MAAASVATRESLGGLPCAVILFQLLPEVLYQAVNGRWQLFELSVQRGTATNPQPRWASAATTSVKKKKVEP
jgi:hypothetical protein